MFYRTKGELQDFVKISFSIIGVLSFLVYDYINYGYIDMFSQRADISFPLTYQR